MVSNDPVGQKEYVTSRSANVRQRVIFTTDGNDVIDFRVQLEVEIDGTWTWVRRYDTSNGEAHMDIKRSNGTEEKHIPMNLPYKAALNHAIGEFEQKWEKFVEWYFRG